MVLLLELADLAERSAPPGLDGPPGLLLVGQAGHRTSPVTGSTWTTRPLPRQLAWASSLVAQETGTGEDWP